MSEIKLCSGKYVDVLNMSESDINIIDIANSLSKICRYNGHCNEFYSVATHSIFVSNHSVLFYVVNAVVNKFVSNCIADITVKDVDDIFSGGFYHDFVKKFIDEHKLYIINLCLAGLLHDSAESYVGDIVKPMKDLPQFSFFRDIENNIIKTIYFKYGIRSFYNNDIVNFADALMLRVEMMSDIICSDSKLLLDYINSNNSVEDLFLYVFSSLIQARIGVFSGNLTSNVFVNQCISMSSFFIKKFFTSITRDNAFCFSSVDLDSKIIVASIINSGLLEVSCA